MPALQSFGDQVDATFHANILAEHEEAWIHAQLMIERPTNRFGKPQQLS
jgi:hypothetical protein